MNTFPTLNDPNATTAVKCLGFGILLFVAFKTLTKKRQKNKNRNNR